MSEYMDQYGSATPSASRNLEEAASEFRRRVEDAAGRLNAAAEQFATMSDGLVAAVEEARQAAERAEQSRRAVEEMKEQMGRDYGNVSELVRDLQQRIGALATLAQPMPGATAAQSQHGESQQEHHEEQPANSGYHNPGESSW